MLDVAGVGAGPGAGALPRPDGVAVLAPGDLVACHWGWVCYRLPVPQARQLRVETVALLDLVNRHLAVPPPAAVLG